MGKIFEALSSSVRREILAYLSATDMTAGEIADRFDISKPSVSKHLSILENAGLIAGEKKGQFIHYRLVRENLVNTLNGFVQEVCPVARPIRKESRTKAPQKNGQASRTPAEAARIGKLFQRAIQALTVFLCSHITPSQPHTPFFPDLCKCYPGYTPATFKSGGTMQMARLMIALCLALAGCTQTDWDGVMANYQYQHIPPQN